MSFHTKNKTVLPFSCQLGWLVIALPIWVTTTCFWLAGTDLTILSKFLIEFVIRNKKLCLFLNSDSWIYTIDQNKWDIGPIPNPNSYYNYVGGICGVVKSGYGKINSNMKMNYN